MKRHRIFISSVQKELSHERIGLRDYIHADPLLRRFFDVFLFEDLPAADRKTDKVFFEKVRSSEIYLGLFGNEYGWDAGMPEPQFGMRSGFLTTIWRAPPKTKEKSKTSGKTSGKILGKTARSIVESMKLNPGITIPELADQLKRTERAIELQINTLRENEMVARVGPAKGGHWEVLE